MVAMNILVHSFAEYMCTYLGVRLMARRGGVYIQFMYIYSQMVFQVLSFYSSLYYHSLTHILYPLSPFGEPTLRITST